MSSVARTGIFIAYHYPEKRWLDRVVTALQQVVGDTPMDIWDDRKLLGGYAWRGELAETLARSKVAIMIVSDPFLLSGFITRAKLPSLLDREREHDLRICWVLAGYCLFSVAGLRAEEAGNGINAALDGLSGAGRDAQIADVARKVAQLLDAPAATPVPAPAVPEPTPAANEPATSAAAESATDATAESKPRARRKRSAKNEPQALLPLLSEVAAPSPIAPPPPQPHLEFPAPKPQTHLTVAEPPDEPESSTAAAATPAVEESPSSSTPTEPASIPAPLPAEAALGPATPPPAERKAETPPTRPGVIVLPPMPPAPAPITSDSDLPPRRAESPLLPALDAVVDSRQDSIDTLRRLARWLKVAALTIAVLSLPAALWIGLTHFLMIFGFALFVASLTLFLHARIALLGQRLVGLRYTRSGLADELLPNRQREPLLRRAADILR